MTRIEAEQFLNLSEFEFFSGSFSVRFIRKDLENRKAIDTYSPFGSNLRRTNELWQKKQVYFQNFNDAEGRLNQISNNYPEWDSRCKRCIKEITELRNLVQNF